MRTMTDLAHYEESKRVCIRAIKGGTRYISIEVRWDGTTVASIFSKSGGCAFFWSGKQPNVESALSALADDIRKAKKPSAISKGHDNG